MFLSCLLLFTTANAQDWVGNNHPEKLDLTKDVHYQVQMQGSFSKDQTPLWLNANKYGLSSLDETNGYVRASVIRPLQTDSARRWGIGYGVDLVGALGYTSNFIVQQAFAEVRWLHGVLSVGSKEYPMELKNNALSSGAQTLGINARPVPQVRLALGDYWVLPFTKGWLRIKGHVAYGKLTDDNWQHDFTNKQTKYADGVLYHSKAGYLKIGNEDRFFPFSLELGLEMASTFGGTAYVPDATGAMQTYEGEGGLKGMWHAFIPGGADAGETTYQNVSGNQLGSWLFRMNYESDTWIASIYGEKFFEDHSGMLFVDRDGYGTGENWQVQEKRKFFVYDIKDMMLGFELKFKYNRLLRNVVFEYLYTKYQSGPIYHDHTPTISDHIGGRDNFYNHYIYTGWQHWGQVMGNPLYRSPIYNTDGTIQVEDNRFMAFHLGLSGDIKEHFNYRILGTYQENFGTYALPYTEKHHNISFLVEMAYHLRHNWEIKGAYAMDFGHVRGSNAGGQLTITKSGIFGKKD